jgi:peptide/nickel transport system ATP-binding protein
MREKVLLAAEALRIRLPSNGGYVNAVDQIDFTVHQGEVFCLVGESGSGKSVTALSMLRLLEQAEFGQDTQIALDNEDLLDISEIRLRKIRGKKIAIIFQEPMTSLNPVQTIGKQIAEVLILHLHMSREAADQRAQALLTQVGIGDPAHALSLYPHQLSGGMRQRVMIAMALATEPDVLIADEPTTALDVTIQAQVLTLLQTLGQSHEMGIILITHDLAIVSTIADTVAVMYAGHIVEQASRAEFFKHPKHPYSQGLLACLPHLHANGNPLPMIPGQLPSMKENLKGCRFAPRCAYAWDHCRAVMPTLDPNDHTLVRCHLYTTPGKSLPSPPDLQQAKTGKERLDSFHEPVLEVNHLAVRYPIKKGLFKRTVGHVNAVSDISFTLNRGETLGIVGESGCGKTSAAFALMRLLDCAQGEVIFEGKNLLALKSGPLRAMRRFMQMIFQDPLGSLNPRMTVREILSEGWDAQKIFPGKAKRELELHRLLDSVGLPEDSLNRYPHEFSGGQHQRIAIARAIALHPTILVCDEPTSALDVSVQSQIINLLRTLQRDNQLSMIFISHNIPVVAYLAHYIAVMYLGKIVEYGRVDQIMESPKHPYTQALLASVPVLSAQAHPLTSPQGEIPSPAHPPSGCHFHTRCPYAMPQCKIEYPGETALEGAHWVRCYLYD